MLLEALGALAAAASAVDSNDVQREQMSKQVEMQKLAIYENERARKHETNMAIIGGVIGLLAIAAGAAASSSQDQFDNE